MSDSETGNSSPAIPTGRRECHCLPPPPPPPKGKMARSKVPRFRATPTPELTRNRRALEIPSTYSSLEQQRQAVAMSTHQNQQSPSTSVEPHQWSRSSLASGPSTSSQSQTESYSAHGLLMMDDNQPCLHSHSSAYYTHIYNNQQYQNMPNSDSRLSSHNMTARDHMHSGDSAALSQELNSALRRPLCTLKDASASTEMCKVEVSSEQQERSPREVQVQTEPPQIKEKQDDQLEIPEEAIGSTFTLPAVKGEDDDASGDTKPLASSTSTEHVTPQADLEGCGAPEPASDVQRGSSHCSQSDISEEESNEGPSNDTLKSHKTHNVNICGQKVGLEKNTGTHAGEKTFFTVGERNVSHLAALKTHMRTHTGEKPFVCEVCGQRFRKSGDLKRHLMTHTGEKPFVCEVCGQRFSHSTSLKTHMRTHTGEKPFVCEVCGQRFSHSTSLKTHMRTHTGEKPFACKVCKQKCSHSGNLKKHLMTHTGEKPFVCLVCGQRIRKSGQLKRHMRTHTGEKPFACKVCEQKFNQHGSLKTHMRTHTGEKPFACKVCEQKFSHSGNLKKHLMTHTGEKPLVCKVCEQGFRRNDGLKSHMSLACEVCPSNFCQYAALKTHLKGHTGDIFECTFCEQSFSQYKDLKSHMRTSHPWI